MTNSIKEDKILALRQELRDILINYEGDLPLKLPIEPHILEQIIFKTHECGRKLAFTNWNLIKKLDLTGVSLDNVFIGLVDFTGSYGVVINPQTIWNKALCQAKLTNVTFEGPFDGCIIEGSYGCYTDFTGSHGAVINPQTIDDKKLRYCIFKDATFSGSFDECEIHDSDFTGSVGAKINPEKVAYKKLSWSTLTDTEIIGSFDGCNIEGTNFTGSIGALINPQTIRNKDLHHALLKDTTLTGSLDGCNINHTDFTGCKNGYQKLLQKK